MIYGVWTVTDVPSNAVGGVMSGFAIDGPLGVTKTAQSNDLWTVVATFPADPTGANTGTTTVFQKTAPDRGSATA